MTNIDIILILHFIQFINPDESNEMADQVLGVTNAMTVQTTFSYKA